MVDVKRYGPGDYPEPLRCRDCGFEPAADWDGEDSQEAEAAFDVHCERFDCSSGVRVQANTRRATVEAWNAINGLRRPRKQQKEKAS